MQKKIILNPGDIDEIQKLINVLQDHKKQYANFKSFVNTCDEALEIATALLNNDFKTFKKFKLKFTHHTAEKMRGIDSLSTYKKTSSVCRWLSQNGGICAKCYAEKSIKLYNAALTPLLIYNTLLLKYIDIDGDNIPYINSKYFRFEAFSDLQGSKHFKNLIAICKKNKSVIFTLWTKTGYLLEKYIKNENIKKLPSNLNIVYSEFNINNKTPLEYMQGMQSVIKSPNALKCFIVYDSENLRKNSGFYLCKNRCIDCLKCYKKSKKILYIAEKIH